MSTFKNPVGPQPSSVYWRRRLLVGAGVLAVILVIVLIVARPGSGKPSPTATTPAASQPSDTPAAQPSGGASGTVAPCTAAHVSITPVTDSTVYAAGVNPKLSMTMTNTGTQPCAMTLGSDVQVYQITSGSDLIWQSTDCQTNPVPLVQTLEPGKPLVFPPFAWDRTRSSKSTCSSKRPQVTAGGASYHLSVTVNGFPSTTSKQFILK
ncbi:hypothetical protein [Galbitalea soli]|uniref:DUF4232 domain-containing protein n=1 Tax=Galbitalea soli TaxID=1268042 RepID=A0A7C9PPA6_9MICO|nr:hypothetical protein [Galbitalea soli]NEM92009.1 hypothetical protein [Galbitalea soli]NYJ32039.1 hypothetical protein [Galbitalea soli]